MVMEQASNSDAEHLLESPLLIKKYLIGSPFLLQAIKKVTFEAFDALSSRKKQVVENRVYTYTGSPQAADPLSSENRDKDHVKTLLWSMDGFESITELKTALRDWAEEGEGEERRELAIERIFEFLNRPLSKLGFVAFWDYFSRYSTPL